MQDAAGKVVDWPALLRQREEWRQLVDAGQSSVPSDDTDSWVARNHDRVVSCIPASGADLDNLAVQLGLVRPHEPQR